MQDVEATIGKLKKVYGVTTDNELAGELMLGKSAISAWRSRGSVPSRYLGAIESNERVPFALTPAEMEDEELCALSLALMRLIRSVGPVTTDQRAFLKHGWNLTFYLLREYHAALKEVEAKGQESLLDGSFSGYQSVFNVMAYDEFFSSQERDDEVSSIVSSKESGDDKSKT